MISALLTQKPESPDPVKGEVKRFTLEQKRKKEKPDETWTKAKNESGDFGGDRFVVDPQEQRRWQQRRDYFWQRLDPAGGRTAGKF